MFTMADQNDDNVLNITEFVSLMLYYEEIALKDKCERMQAESSQTRKTFMSEYVEDTDSNHDRTVLMLYFALTTLSTVGYGDYHPVSLPEMIYTCIVMLGGVAFFSYIMGNFIEIISNYEAKMGNLDKSDELSDWILSLDRFTNKTKKNMSISLVNSVISNINYLWDHDRLGCFDENDPTFNLLPSYIKNELIFKYLYSDIFSLYPRFFFPKSRPNMRNDKYFLSQMAKGLMPR